MHKSYAVIAIAIGIGSFGHAGEREDLLTSLGTELRIVRASTGPDPTRIASPTPSVAMIRGAAREDIRSSLGQPDNCRNESACNAERKWVYRFYYLPENWIGGGPQLHIEFDRKDHVRSADWIFTQ